MTKATSVSKTSGLGSRILIGFFALFWCGLVGFFDYFLFSTIVRQLKATRFAQAPATIISSELKRNNSGDGDTYSVNVQFRYAVEGREYIGEKYSFDTMSTSDSRWARRAVAENFAGAETTSYYDPENPSRAILKPGIEGSHLFMLMFITPFNVVGLGMIWFVLTGTRPDERTSCVEDRINNTEIFTLNSWSPSGAFMGMMALGSFVGIFITLIPSGFHPTMTKVGVIWGSVFVFAVATTIWTQRLRSSGKYDLVLDKNAQTVTVPAMHRRAAPETIRFKEVQDFSARSTTTGSGEDESTTHEVFLQKKDGTELLLKQEYTAASAISLTETLRERLLV